MLERIHPLSGALAFLTILTFWVSTVMSESFGAEATITAVKLSIPWGFLILVPALAITGFTGLRMAGASADPAIVGKKRRMPFIAGNGLLVLVPSAIYLAVLASRGAFGTVFYAVQAIELIAGAVNLTLMALNMRDGLRLSGRLKDLQTV